MPPQPAIPINLLYWLLALVPLAVLLVLLVVFRWPATQAGPAGYLAAVIISFLFFRTPIETLAVGAAKGFWDAIFILYIVWTALALYEVARTANAFEAFREGVQRFTPNRLVQFFAFAFVFVLFLQATAGFGTPVAVVAPLLVGLGIQPVYAVALALIGHVWGNSFGVLAISWIAMNLVVNVAQPAVTLLVSTFLLAVAVLASALTLAYVFGGRNALRDGALLIAVLVLIYGLGQMAIVNLVPELAALVPATVALGALYILGRLPRYQRAMAGDVRRSILTGRGADQAQQAAPSCAKQSLALRCRRQRYAPLITGRLPATVGRTPSLLLGFVPYYALVGFLLLALALTQLIPALANFRLGFSFPATMTGFGATVAAVDIYSGLNPIRHPGTSILLATITGYIILARRGFIPRGALWPLLGRVARNALPASIAVIGFLATSQTMVHSGQILVLARGIAAVLGPVLYSGASVFIGVLGAFITSSNTASNILFSPLQVQSAAALGINQGIILGGQMAGGAYGNAIAPANIILGTSTTHIAGQEGTILRLTLPWTLAVAAIGSLLLIGIYFLI